MLEDFYFYISKYTGMNLGRITVNCPYWVNIIRNNKVVIRGYLNGKGEADIIKEELVTRLKQKKISSTNLEEIRKFARRERIGIDCSGLAYRLIDKLLSLNYNGCKINILADYYKETINRLNANVLTAKQFCIRIFKIKDAQIGDFIRMVGGRHICVIIKIEKNRLIYLHSSRLTKIQGAHEGEIVIKDRDADLNKQNWTEKTIQGQNFGIKYFHLNKEDGIFRLKIFEK
ncbi:hypothetical protein A2Y99_03845 [Candidatus Gottesmanbacteria bacterium RBG_13_37_7]|uniref:NlpC/P60 domain-containing protein n=1 Tax=Candidatus Gottesmanbacteria bacterium RBG_13_37_7 TaxID=1798369 RepID=A0A1F5YHI8_9BACT|nr:MAG: hypothetical protein A2Y99_03845 [Candidatus Gottesmanbacteria bacterium RBG_13_37_7]